MMVRNAALLLVVPAVSLMWSGLPTLAVEEHPQADEAEHEDHLGAEASPMADTMPAEDHTMMGHDPLMDPSRTMGSGTSAIPKSSPMRMWSWRAGDWLMMAHGDLVTGLNRQGASRGDLTTPTWLGNNWGMFVGSRMWGSGILDLRFMGSLEPWTTSPGGTPLLFQTGETYQGLPLVDRQHPHDAFIELAGRYTYNLSPATSFFLYGGLAGEPALGPTAFLHRPSAADNQWAVLGHHLQDSTHIAYGVATLGAQQGAFRLEGSLFNGREPDENRLGFDFGPLDSWSTRMSFLPHPNWAAQVSTGRLKSPEALEPGDIHRTTASVMHVFPLPDGAWSTSLIWGQNIELHEGVRPLQSYGVETQWDWRWVNHLYGRFELVDKSGLPLGGNRDELRRVGALTFGMARDLDWSDRLDLAVGADATAYSLDPETKAVYGANPLSFRVFLRLRPPTMGQPMSM